MQYYILDQRYLNNLYIKALNTKFFLWQKLNFLIHSVYDKNVRLGSWFRVKNWSQILFEISIRVINRQLVSHFRHWEFIRTLLVTITITTTATKKALLLKVKVNRIFLEIILRKQTWVWFLLMTLSSFSHLSLSSVQIHTQKRSLSIE